MLADMSATLTGVTDPATDAPTLPPGGVRLGTGFLSVDPMLLPAWRARLADDDAARGAAPVLRVGLVWACPHRWDHGRSMRLPVLTPLLEADPAVAFYSLQSGPPGLEIRALPEGVRPIDHGADLQGPADAAALVSLLDLVVTVDMAMARLADGLGCAVWLPAPRGRPPGEAWSFGTGGVRVFAQPRPSDWRPPVARMAAELAAMALSRVRPSTPDAFRPGPDWFQGYRI